MAEVQQVAEDKDARVANFTLARACMEQNDYKQAEALLLKCFGPEAGAWDAVTWGHLAHVYTRSKRYKDAEHALRMVVEVDCDGQEHAAARTHYQRGKVCAALGQTVEAESHFSSALTAHRCTPGRDRRPNFEDRVWAHVEKIRRRNVLAASGHASTQNPATASSRNREKAAPSQLQLLHREALYKRVECAPSRGLAAAALVRLGDVLRINSAAGKQPMRPGVFTPSAATTDPGPGPDPDVELAEESYRQAIAYVNHDFI